MKPKKTSFYLEFKQLFCIRHLAIIAIFFALLLVIAQIDIIEYKKELKEIDIANKLEKLKVEQFDRYKPYAAYGIRFFTMPSPLNFLSGYKIYGGLIAAVDHGTKLSIYETKKGIKVLPDPSYGFLNFTGLLLIFGSFLAMMLGYTAFNNEMLLRFLFSLKSDARTFWIRLTSRMIFIAAVLICLALSVFLLAWANGLTIPLNYFLIFVGVAILVMNFFLFLGTVSGSLKTRLKRITTFICLFLVVTVFSLLVFVKIVNSISNNISEYQTEYDKLRLLMTFEINGLKRFGNVRSGDELNTFFKGYLNNEVKILEDMESRYKKEISDRVDIYQGLACLCPATFFLTSANELSGNGYDTFFGFYGLTEQMKSAFIKFFFEKEYFTTPVPGKVESFIKGDENIYSCRGSLLKYFWIGIFLTLLYIAVLAVLTYRFNYNKIYPVKKQLENEEDIYTFIRKGEPNLFFTQSELVKAKLYNHFSGKEKLKGDISFVPDGNLTDQEKIDFLYIGPVFSFKHISPTTLHLFFFGEKPEKNMETWEVLLKYALTFQVVIFDGFMETVDPRKLADTKKLLAEQEIYSLVITSDFYFAGEYINEPQNLKFQKNDLIGQYLETKLKGKSK